MGSSQKSFNLSPVFKPTFQSGHFIAFNEIFCLQKEQKLREELTRLGYNEYDEQLKEKRNK